MENVGFKLKNRISVLAVSAIIKLLANRENLWRRSMNLRRCDR